MGTLTLKNSKNGKGVFANKEFKKNERIIGFQGKLLTYEEFPRHYTKFEDHCVQIGKNLYMSPSGEIDDFFNHSCNPNSGLKIKDKKAFLIAVKNIKNGEEITWDYSTTMDEDFWEIECKCGIRNCRKRIRDFKYLPKKIQQKYIKLGIAPKYLIEEFDNLYK
ncbi:SET domain-containing protein [Candidatus Woesearchaeota archaeon]|nr:SET domain-containing protein [Candidatus Woesearchaeota archaeon]